MVHYELLNRLLLSYLYCSLVSENLLFGLFCLVFLSIVSAKPLTWLLLNDH